MTPVSPMLVPGQPGLLSVKRNSVLQYEPETASVPSFMDWTIFKMFPSQIQLLFRAGYRSRSFERKNVLQTSIWYGVQGDGTQSSNKEIRLCFAGSSISPRLPYLIGHCLQPPVSLSLTVSATQFSWPLAQDGYRNTSGIFPNKARLHCVFSLRRGRDLDLAFDWSTWLATFPLRDSFPRCLVPERHGRE